MARTRKVILDNLAFGEGPRWHKDRLFFADMYNNKVFTLDMKGKVEFIVEVPNRPSGMGWDLKGRLLIISMLDRKLMRFENGKLSVLADLSKYAPADTNDMVVDGRGHAYIGNLGYQVHHGETPKPADVIMVDTNTGAVRVVAGGFMIPNGTVVTPDNKTLIIAESIGHKLWKFDITADGSLTNKKLFADFKDGIPDGIALDAEGAVWTAVPTWNEYCRVFEGTRIVERIKIEGRSPIAVALGGPDRKTMYMCTSMSIDGKQGPGHTKGWLESTQVDVPGAGWP
ncbi:MAG: SMP-30/gluconolactonase/LRE family protein [Chloroflexi bacterium]|nr:SMP-30/gluconolactonase/LRE family protein [Chloroflexota bacterium]